MPITVPQDLATLLSYFRTADHPTQDQFEELIRTMFFLYQETVDAAAAAQAAAEAVVAAAATYGPRVVLTATIPNTSSNTWTNRYSVGVASIAHISLTGAGASAQRVLRVTFTDAFGDAYYSAHASGRYDTSTTDTSVEISIEKSAGSLDLVLPQTLIHLNLAIWDTR